MRRQRPADAHLASGAAAPADLPGQVARLACLVQDGARSLASRLTAPMLLGAAIEAAWVTTHVVTYPIGTFFGRGAVTSRGLRIEHLAPVQRGLLASNVEAAGTPILLVHGLIDNRSIFTLLKRGLSRRGFGSIFAMNYSIFTSDIRVAALELAGEVERIVEETGYERIHVIGHSLGGLIARYYVTRLGGDSRVHTLVTLGTPHQGTYMAYLWPTAVARQMRPGSGFIEELAEPVPRCQTRFLCYWSDADELVFPQRNAELIHPDLDVRSVALSAVGHASLPIVGDVVHGISTALAHLDHDGSTATDGAIPIDSRTPRPRSHFPA
ncbi:MAG: alpha/beta fold hydrolase [Phycicoccus sp.]|nr:alpha/beta fold hydrolase [Phycicoccus sp.]